MNEELKTNFPLLHSFFPLRYSIVHMDTTNDAVDAVQDGEIVPTSDGTGAEVLINMESMIKSTITGLDTGKTELKKMKEMLTDTFANDPTYQEHEKLAKEANKIKSKTKSELLKQPAATDLNKKIKELAVELKESQDGLSEYLREYQRLSGSNEIEGDDGEVREIVFTAKLVKRSGRFQ